MRRTIVSEWATIRQELCGQLETGMDRRLSGRIDGMMVPPNLGSTKQRVQYCTGSAPAARVGHAGSLVPLAHGRTHRSQCVPQPHLRLTRTGFIQVTLNMSRAAIVRSDRFIPR